MDIADVDTSPTRDLEPGQSPPRSAELPEPTADREPEPAAVAEPSPSGATELPIVPEPEPQVSDQVREPTIRATVETAVEIAGAMERPAHCTTTEGEHKLDLGDLIDFQSDTLVLQPFLELYPWEYIAPKFPLPPPLLDLLLISTPSSLDLIIRLCSPSAHHLWCGLAAGLPIPSSVAVESGGSLDSAFSLRGPDSASVLQPSGSTTASSSLVSTRARQSSSGSITTCSTAVGRSYGVGGHSSTMAPHSVGSSMGHHHDCGLGLHLTPPAPGFPLAPPTVHSPMDFYDVLCLVCPLSCSTPSSRAPTLPPQLDCYGARTRLSGRGRTVIYLCLHCDLVLPVLFN